MILNPQNFQRSDGWNPVGISYNAIRNPQMSIASRGTSIAVGLSGGLYALDGWRQANETTLTTTNSQVAITGLPLDTSVNRWYPYTPYGQNIQISTAQASIPAAGYCVVYQSVEGLIAAPLIGVPTSISLLALSSIVGTFAVALRNRPAFTWSIAYDCTFTAANTWHRFEIPNIPAFPAAGVFATDNTSCYDLLICIGAGSTNTLATPGVWTNANGFATPNTTNWAASTSNYFRFTLVQHEPNPFCTPFVQRHRVEEEMLNYRYRTPDINCGIGWISSSWSNTNWTYSMGQIKYPEMRAAPTAGNAVLANSSSTATVLAIEQINIQQANVYDAYNGGVGNMPSGGWAKINGGSFTAEL